MEYIICCLCSLLCFACGVWAARGLPKLPRRRQPEEDWCEEDDALSRDARLYRSEKGGGCR